MPSVLQPRPYYNVAPGSQSGPSSSQQIPAGTIQHRAPQSHRPGAMSFVPYGMPHGHPAGMAGQAWVPGGPPYPSYSYPSRPYSPMPNPPQMAQFPSSAGSSSVRSTQTDSPGSHYHVPASDQSYIAPRRIMPSSIRNPLIETANKRAQTDAPNPAPAPRQQAQAMGVAAGILATPTVPAVRAVQGRTIYRPSLVGVPASCSTPPASAGTDRAIADRQPERRLAELETARQTRADAHTPLHESTQHYADPPKDASGNVEKIPVRTQPTEASSKPQ